MEAIKKLISVVFVITAMAVHSGICYAQSWDFENFTEGTDITTGNGIIVSVDAEQRNSYVSAVKEENNIVAQIGFEAGDTDLSSAPYLQVEFDKVSQGQISVDFKLKYDVLSSSAGKIPVLYADFLDEQGNTIGKFVIDGRRYSFIYSDGSKSYTTRTAIETWYNLSFVLDLEREVYGYSIDEKVCVADRPLYECYSRENGICAVRIYADNTNKNTSIISVDDISVEEYTGVSITDVTVDDAVIAEDSVISDDARMFTFSFESAVEETFAQSDRVFLKNSAGEMVDISTEFSEDRTSLIVTLGEKLDKNEKYSFEFLLTDFAATKYEFSTQPRENYIMQYRFTDSNGEEISNPVSGKVKFVFTPSGISETVTAIIMVHNGSELVDIACAQKHNNTESEIEIAVDDSDYTVTAFVIDSFANRIPLMEAVSIPITSAEAGTATEQKTNLTFDEDTLSLTASASLLAERKQELSWFLINPKVPDYTFADVNESNIKSVVIDAGVATLSEDNNAFICEKLLGENPAIGRYQVWFADNEAKLGDGEKIKTTVYINETAVEDAMTALKSASSIELGSLLSYYTNSIVLLNLDLDNTIYTTYMSEVHELMSAQISQCEEPTDIDRLFETCINLVELNHLPGGKVEFIRSRGEVFGIDFTDDYVSYSLTDEAIENYFDIGIGVTSVQDTATKMRTAFAMAIINSIDISKRSQYPTILNEYNDVFGLNLSSSVYKKNSSNVYQAFLKKTLETASDVKSKYDTWISGLNNQSSGGTSSGNGTGGSYSKTSSAAVIGSIADIQSDKNTIVSSSVFNDLDSAVWAKEYILALYHKGIVSGDGKGGFNPNKAIKREEAVKMIVSAFEFEGEQEMLEFTDVSDTEWYYTYIEKAVRGGIINGVSENTFGTGKNITRAEIAAILYRCVLKQNPDVKANRSNFSDSDLIPEYAKASVDWLASENIISGRTDGNFDPYANATRAEFSKMLALVIDYTTGGATNE